MSSGRYFGLSIFGATPVQHSPILHYFMKKLILLAAGVTALGLGSCNSKCPAYTSTKAANRVASPVTASVAAPAARQ